MRTVDGDAVDDVAAGWVAREDRGALSAVELIARDAWLAADTRHFGAYARARAVLARSERAQALASHPLPTVVVRSRPRAVAPRQLWRWVAGVVLVAGLVGLGVQQNLHGTRVYATAKGEILRVPLADGSALTLDSATRVRVAYTDRTRSVELLQGEALFDVAKNPHRPFVVHARDTNVTAIGTSFAVSLTQRYSAGVEVLVREGVVEVADADGEVAPTRLPAQHRALASRSHGIRIEAVPDKDLQQQLAWREGMLAFDGDTLSAAAAQFLRYSDTRIVIDDPAVGSRRIVGLYSASDPVGFAHNVAVSLGLTIERDGNEVRLERPQTRTPTPHLARVHP